MTIPRNDPLAGISAQPVALPAKGIPAEKLKETDVSAHASQHKTGGSDTVGAGEIGAAADDHTHGPKFTELFSSFSATGAGAWEAKDLSAEVAANAVCQVVMVNADATNQRNTGVRAVNSTLDRFIDLGEDDSAVTMLVTADSGGIIEIYAEDTTDITFYLMGYWS